MTPDNLLRAAMALMVVGFVWRSYKWQERMADEQLKTRANSDRLAQTILEELRKRK